MHSSFSPDPEAPPNQHEASRTSGLYISATTITTTTISAVTEDILVAMSMSSSEAGILPSAGDDTAVNLSPLRFRRHARLAATQNLPVLSGFEGLEWTGFCLRISFQAVAVSTLVRVRLQNDEVLCLVWGPGMPGRLRTGVLFSSRSLESNKPGAPEADYLPAVNLKSQHLQSLKCFNRDSSILDDPKLLNRLRVSEGGSTS